MKQTLFLLILIVSASLGAESIEQITLNDGRVLIGIYDEAGQRLQIKTGSINAWVPINAAQIAKREVIQFLRDKTNADAIIEAENNAAKGRVMENERRAAEIEARRQAVLKSKAAREERETQALAVQNIIKQREEQAKIEAKAAQFEAVEQEKNRKIEQDRSDRQELDRQARVVEARQAQEYKNALLEAKAKKEEAALKSEMDAKAEREKVEQAAAITAALLLLVGAFFAFLLPGILAGYRKHKYKNQIQLILFLIFCALILVQVVAVGQSRRPLAGVSTIDIIQALYCAASGIAWCVILVWATWPGMNEAMPVVEGQILRRASRAKPGGGIRPFVPRADPPAHIEANPGENIAQ